MSLRHPEIRLILLFGFAFLLLSALGCGSDDDPTTTTPDPEALISATLSRANGIDDGTRFQDGIVLWVAAEEAAGLAAMRVGGVVTGDPLPADPDGVEFVLDPSLDVSLFDAGGVIEMELLDAAGAVAATVLAEAPAAATAILSPTVDEQVSPDGFAVSWQSDGQGTVTIALASTIDSTEWQIVTENDGHYEISANALADFPKGRCGLQVVRVMSELLTSHELGGGLMEQTLSGHVVVRLAN